MIMNGLGFCHGFRGEPIEIERHLKGIEGRIEEDEGGDDDRMEEERIQ